MRAWPRRATASRSETGSTTTIYLGAIDDGEPAIVPTFEGRVGLRGLRKFGKKKWRAYVNDVIEILVAALEPEDVVIGGGNAAMLKQLPAGVRRSGQSY